MLQQFLNEAKTEKPVAKSIEPPPQAITYKGVPIVFDPHIGANEAVIVPAEPAEVLEEIDPPPPCPRCGSLELWESPTRPAGHRWRCRRCDPPHRAEAWARKAARLREEKELRSKQQY